MNTLRKKLFIALFGLMTVGAIGGVIVAGYSIVIGNKDMPNTDTGLPIPVEAPISAPAGSSPAP